ncbi:hypothetical protein D3C86_2247640 [compost metagenome]
MHEAATGGDDLAVGGLSQLRIACPIDAGEQNATDGALETRNDWPGCIFNVSPAAVLGTAQFALPVI